jgi:hypothetical protein
MIGIYQEICIVKRNPEDVMDFWDTNAFVAPKRSDQECVAFY